MAEIDNELNDPGVDSQDESSSAGQGKQTLLLKLAERTVLQAEALAQEITDRARKASEAEGVKLLERYTGEAQDEVRRILEEAKKRSTEIIAEATAQANDEKQSILRQAHKDEQEVSARARAEEHEIVSKAQYEAQTLVSASKAGAESIESNATLRAEFIIWQMSQNAADEIRRAVLDICNNLLPELNAIGAQHLEKFAPGSEDQGGPIAAELLAKIGMANNAADERAPKAATGPQSGPQSGPQKDQTPSGNHSSESQSTGKSSGRSKAPSPAEFRGTS